MRLLLLAIGLASLGCAHVKPDGLVVPKVVIGPKQDIKARFNAVDAQNGELYVCLSSEEEGALVLDCLPYLMFLETLQNYQASANDEKI
jgi:hypothetical protein